MEGLIAPVSISNYAITLSAGGKKERKMDSDRPIPPFFRIVYSELNCGRTQQSSSPPLPFVGISHDCVRLSVRHSGGSNYTDMAQRLHIDYKLNNS